jgi:hypothetical protein
VEGGGRRVEGGGRREKAVGWRMDEGGLYATGHDHNISTLQSDCVGSRVLGRAEDGKDAGGDGRGIDEEEEE